MPKQPVLTTEIPISANDSLLADIIHNRYGRMERGEVRAELEELYGTVWDETELQQLYDIDQHEPPYVRVKDRSSGKPCTLAYTENPRFYFLLQCEDANG